MGHAGYKIGGVNVDGTGVVKAEGRAGDARVGEVEEDATESAGVG